MKYDFDKQVTTIIIILIICFFGWLSILSISNGRFEFSIDESTENAIEDLSKFSNESVKIEVNNYNGDDMKCIQGCEQMHYNLVGYDGSIAMQGNNDIFWSQEDCKMICEDLEEGV